MNIFKKGQQTGYQFQVKSERYVWHGLVNFFIRISLFIEK